MTHDDEIRYSYLLGKATAWIEAAVCLRDRALATARDGTDAAPAEGYWAVGDEFKARADGCKKQADSLTISKGA